jgi:hypothetical protein
MIQLINVVLAATPTPAPEIDPNTVSPGVVGFIAIAVVGLATLLLGIDLTRRIRRTTYRAEISARLEAELAQRNAANPDKPVDGADGAAKSE